MPPLHFFAQLLNPRPTWPDDITPDESKIMEEHFYYLSDLAARKKVILAGPCFNPVFGMIVLQVESEEELLEIMNNDPSVKCGLNSFKYQPMRASILAEHLSRKRYVETPSDKILRVETTVAASQLAVWNAWTTTEGINSFFSESADIELRLGGKFEVYFSDKVPYGQRGSEGCRVLSFLPNSMLSFEWNAPPEFGKIRYELTQVILQFEKISESETRVILTQRGWGSGGKWDELYAYFERAWGYVLNNLKEHFAENKTN